MLHISKAIDIAQDKKPHTFKFIAKGGKKRNGGYVVTMENSIVTSSNHERRKMNLFCNTNGQRRWCYFVLLIELDGHEIIM